MTEKTSSRYELRGVSSCKEGVHHAIKHLSPGIFPGAFCMIHPDIFGGNEDYCTIQHADGAGTKAGLAYLYWKIMKETQADQSVLDKIWKNIVKDSLFMNLDDVACVGGLGTFMITSTIDRNKFLIPDEVISALINGCDTLCRTMMNLDICCILAGGETADVGDLVRTLVVNNTVSLRMKRSDVIDASKITAPGFIVGFSSTGQAAWEDEPNSGIGSNGLTNARHDTLASVYRTHTETFSPEIVPSLVYAGKYKLTDKLPGDERFTIASALLSPTRTYAPLVKRLIEKLSVKNIMALIHCSGGGQTKIGKFGPPGLVYLKDNLFPLPPLFRFLQQVRVLPWKEMYASYNMGHRLEAVVKTKSLAEECIDVAKECNIEAQIVGTVERDESSSSAPKVVIKSRDSGESHMYP